MIFWPLLLVLQEGLCGRLAIGQESKLILTHKVYPPVWLDRLLTIQWNWPMYKLVLENKSKMLFCTSPITYWEKNNMSLDRKNYSLVCLYHKQTCCFFWKVWLREYMQGFYWLQHQRCTEVKNAFLESDKSILYAHTQIYFIESHFKPLTSG